MSWDAKTKDRFFIISKTKLHIKKLEVLITKYFNILGKVTQVDIFQKKKIFTKIFFVFYTHYSILTNR